MFTSRPTPAKMTQEAANKIPRYALWILIALFLLNSLWAQDLWTLRDATSFGLAESLKSNFSLTSFIFPTINGNFVTENGPLTAWLAASLMKIFSALFSDITTYRFASIFWCSLSFFAIWYGTWFLTRHPDAQPLPFAFGGEASSKDYGRVIADCALLLYIASFGIATRHYEGAPYTALLTFSSLTLFGVARSLLYPYQGSIITGLSVGLCLITTNLFAASWLFSASFIANICIKGIPGNRDKRVTILTLLSLLPILIWVAIGYLCDAHKATLFFTTWASSQINFFGLISLSSAEWILKNFAWFWLPLWPLALWGVYSWRRQYECAHVQAPYSILLTGALFLLISSTESVEQILLVMVPALAVSSAFAIPSIKQTKENILDWFSLAIFSIAIIAVWLYWLAWATEFAPKMAKSVYMQAPNTHASFDWGFMIALVTTLVWCFFLAWRVTHRPVVAWRGSWLAASGMTACLVCVMGLFSSAITDNRTYSAVANKLSTEVKILSNNSACIYVDNIPIGIVSILSYYGDIKFGNFTCRFKLIRTRNEIRPLNAVSSFSRSNTEETFWLIDNKT